MKHSHAFLDILGASRSKARKPEFYAFLYIMYPTSTVGRFMKISGKHSVL